MHRIKHYHLGKKWVFRAAWNEEMHAGQVLARSLNASKVIIFCSDRKKTTTKQTQTHRQKKKTHTQLTLEKR
jgi:environmental stress-induced protein Ves